MRNVAVRIGAAAAVGVLGVVMAAGAGAADLACGKPMTEAQKTQRLLDIAEIANVASSHEYYHSAWMHKEEVENSWSKREDVSWTNNVDRYSNRKSFWAFYVENLKSFPTKGTLAYHMLTTPIIEVAGDGQTAKAIFMSFGNVAGPGMGGGPAQAQWTEEKYGMDFIKENGRWKIWHLRTYVEYYANVGGSFANAKDNQAALETIALKEGKTVDMSGPPPAPPGADGKGAPAGGANQGATVQREATGATFAMAKPDEKKLFYPGYTTDRDPQYNPQIPQPYCRFSEVTAY